jgi:excisionase family DNA binding protein
VTADDDRLLTVSEVAAYLRIGPESVRRWLRDGKLPGIDLGRGAGWRIRHADVREFVASHRTAPDPAGVLTPQGDGKVEDRS